MDIIRTVGSLLNDYDEYETISMHTMLGLGFEPIAYYDFSGNLLAGPVQDVFLCTFYDGEHTMTFLCSP